MAKSPEELAHLEWIGFVQPVGLVVSVPALLEAQCYVNKNISSEHARFLDCLLCDPAEAITPEIRDLAEFTQRVLGWEAADLVAVPQRSVLTGTQAALEVVLPQYQETLRPTHAVPVFGPAAGQNPWTMLIGELATGTDFDAAAATDSAQHWNAAPQAKFERLLRETGVPLGLLTNRRQLRLVYAPKGESSGHATFDVAEMRQVAGRPMFAALQMLLGAERLFSLGERQRLPAILENSRKYQNTVSTKLAEQVLAALYELIRGFQAADDVRTGNLLRSVLAAEPNHVYSGLLTVLMRLVFLLYAEDRGLLSGDPIYANHYSVTGLFNRLREEAGRFPDTMNQRFGAWSQLITLFRLVYEGGQHADFRLPARKGYLFDPNRYPFLEGRDWGLGDGDLGLGLGNRGSREGNNVGHQVLPGSAGLAVGNEPDGAVLSGDQVLPAGGNLRSHEPDSTRGQFDPGEHRRRTRPGQQGIPAISENRSGKPDGIGDTSDDRAASRNPSREQIDATAADHRTTRPHAQQSATSPHTLTPTPQPPIPRVSDAIVYNVLRNLLILDGERLSYRSLDVEQIGSVYETVMGFNLEVAAGQSIAIKPVKSHGAPATINLAALLAVKGKDRAKWLKEQSDQTLGKDAAGLLKEAATIEGLLAALDKKIAKKVTPRVVPAGAMVLQPSDERRRSGSHYTPRSLTEPIVRTTLAPILEQFCDSAADLPAVYQPSRADKRRYTAGELDGRVRASAKAIEYATLARGVGTPHPAQILDLKICDPAMGSGAFLVEACRQLGDQLVDAWAAHGLTPAHIPPDEDELLYARRLVAQRCLYGVDKNVMAVDLAKLALWLVTLAKEHPFTFLDHLLRHGDSLVGLSRQQIIGFHWEPKKQKQFGEELIQQRLDKATAARAKILNAPEDVPYLLQQQKLALADEALSVVRLTANACVSAFFAGAKKKDREECCEQLRGDVQHWYESGHHINTRGPVAAAAASLRGGDHPLEPFHWEIEFPELFARENGGFDAFVGNPPFAGGRNVSASIGPTYLQWMLTIHDESSGGADLVAHFFRRAFNLLRTGGGFGLIATNTIAQGDTRSTGLRWLCTHGGEIYHAQRRYKWPGLAAVVVSVVHVAKGRVRGIRLLDGRAVPTITAFLFHRGGHTDPARLRANAGKSFVGSYVLGMGFTFDDTDTKGVATPLAEMQRLIAANPRNAERIFPYIGGEEVNSSPTHAHHRYVINFGEMSEEDARDGWPALMAIVEDKVKPDRITKDAKKYPRMVHEWWKYWNSRPELQAAIAGLERVLVISRVGQHAAIGFAQAAIVFSDSLIVFPFESYTPFGVLQSRAHEIWTRFFASSMKDDLRYTPSDCFETFPFPPGVLDGATASESLEAAGREYYEYRAALMVRNDEGLTKTYNRFHDPDERSPEIHTLRELHAAMDAAVLEAYGWHDLAATARCEFLLDYEDDAGDETAKPTKKKKPWRLRWPDNFRDEVLARLLELNAQRHKEELLVGKGGAAKSAEKTSQPRKAPPTQPEPDADAPQPELF